MLKIQNITLQQGMQVLIDDGTIFIKQQQKVGIIGFNG